MPFPPLRHTISTAREYVSTTPGHHFHRSGIPFPPLNNTFLPQEKAGISRQRGGGLEKNSKFQIPNYKQIPNYNDQNYKTTKKTLKELWLLRNSFQIAAS
jgi:hypothetical protein